jgi:outer membrane protein assembly factor BamD (BamD/ComL family)
MKQPASLVAVFLLMVLVAAFTLVQGAQKLNSEERALYDKGTKLIEYRQFESARFTLQTLINVYPDSPLVYEAKAAIRTSWVKQGFTDVDAMLLFEEGEARLRARKYEASRFVFQTLINAYPKSRYVLRAKDAIRRSLQQEEYNR